MAGSYTFIIGEIWEIFWERLAPPILNYVVPPKICILIEESNPAIII